MPKLSPDEKWKRFNKKLEESMKQNDFFGLGTTYYQMADFLKKEEKNSTHLRQKGYEMKLISTKATLAHFKDVGVTKIEILGDSESSCEICKKIHRKTFNFKDATNTNPIPVRECAHKYGCRCVYIPA